MIAVDVLNRALRPFLAQWHPLLLDWKTQRPAGKSPAQHEAEWPQNTALRGGLETVQRIMLEYADGARHGRESSVSPLPAERPGGVRRNRHGGTGKRDAVA